MSNPESRIPNPEYQRPDLEFRRKLAENSFWMLNSGFWIPFEPLPLPGVIFVPPGPARRRG